MMPELNKIIREATQEVETLLNIEDKGWTNLSASSHDVLSADDRKTAVVKSRTYATRDPLAKQALRLWTDYTFGTGMNWHSEEKNVSDALSKFWDDKANAEVLSARGQRKSSDKLLIDGEIFFAVFLGSSGEAKIRTIDPLEITEIITNPDDIEDVRYYKREWMTPQGKARTGYYKSFGNEQDEATIDMYGATVRASENALVYHLAYNTMGLRGLPLLLPAIEWIDLYRRFLASRVAVMLALARFAWKVKVQGGQASVTAVKSVYDDKKPAAGSMAIENMGADLQPIRTDSGAASAYQDGRMIKLQIAAATGWPEQYFGDVSTGNLATAQTVELPVQKMCQSYQAVWADAYNTIDQLVLDHAGIPEKKRYIDRDFPAISPEDAGTIATSIAALIPVMPALANSRDVMQQALMAVGVHDTNEAMDKLGKAVEESAGDVNVNLIKALREFKRTISGSEE